MTLKNKLIPSDYCLRVTLTKDLSYKYGRYLDENDSGTIKPPWCVAGTYDYLETVRLESLDSLSDPVIQEPWEDSRRLILYPFENPRPGKVALQAMLCPDAETYPLLAIIMITLSPLAYELRPGVGAALRSIRNVVGLLDETSQDMGLDKRNIAHLGSLSGPDLVTVAAAKDPNELQKIHRLVESARTFSLDELEKGKYQGDSRDRGQGEANWPGHACVCVTPLLAFQLDAETGIFNLGRFKEAEKECGLRLRFRLRVDCGHEHQVIDDLKKAGAIFEESPRGAADDAELLSVGETECRQAELQDRDAQGTLPRSEWDSHTLFGTFRHMADLARVWRTHWFSSDPHDKSPCGWRGLNLIDSVTVISFPDSKPQWPQSRCNWTIAEEIRGSLSDIWSKQLSPFADVFLNATQMAELKSLYNSFHSCFFRQDLLGVGRDLYPFFRQLGNALGDIDQWRRFFQSKQADPVSRISQADGFEFSIESLISHVSRAVRNRIEHRALEGDPPYPQTLREGPCKIVSAYTVVFYLCWELFRLGPKDGPSPFVGTDHFAACINAGTRGRIAFDELFDEFRHFVEKDPEAGTGSPNLLSQRPCSEWSSRLLVGDIGGWILSQPELLVVHCLHEAAELSDCIELPRFAKVRLIFNEWVSNQVIAALRDEMALASYRNLYGNGIIEQEKLKTEVAAVRDFAGWFVPFRCATHRFHYDKMDMETLTNRQRFLESDLHPTAWLFHHMDAFSCEMGANTLATFAQVMGTSAQLNQRHIRPPQAEHVISAVMRGKLRERLNMLSELVKETVADTGLVFGLYNLRRITSDFSEDSWTEDLCTVFKSIYHLTTKVYGPGRPQDRIQQLVTRRWAIQLAANKATAATWRTRIIKELSELASEKVLRMLKGDLETAARDETIFGKHGLTAALRAFKPYGGDKEVEFVPLTPLKDELPDVIVKAFNDAWEDKSTGSRIRLLQLLWAKSVRFVEPRLFVKNS